jgi:predicted dehydrogenase
VFDLNRELAQKRAGEFGIDRVFDTVEQLIDACEVVDVATPPQTHAKIARQVLAAGRHLIIEKPVVIDVADWDSIAAAVKTSGAKLGVIHNLKFAQGPMDAKAWVDQGRIGRVIRIQREFLTSPRSDRMLVGDNHWSHRLPGGRWFETMPHELYLTHWFAGPLELANVTIASTPNAPSGAPADEVAISLRGDSTLGTIHFSANCEANRRIFTVTGTEGQIVVDILGDQATLNTVHEKKWKRAIGLNVLAAGQALIRAVPDRIGYGLRHARKESAHLRAIRQFGLHVRDLGEPPTPLDEVEYVVRNGELIGRAIDAQLAAQRAAKRAG